MSSSGEALSSTPHAESQPKGTGVFFGPALASRLASNREGQRASNRSRTLRHRSCSFTLGSTEDLSRVPARVPDATGVERMGPGVRHGRRVSLDVHHLSRPGPSFSGLDVQRAAAPQAVPQASTWTDAHGDRLTGPGLSWPEQTGQQRVGLERDGLPYAPSQALAGNQGQPLPVPDSIGLNLELLLQLPQQQQQQQRQPEQVHDALSFNAQLQQLPNGAAQLQEGTLLWPVVTVSSTAGPVMQTSNLDEFGLVQQQQQQQMLPLYQAGGSCASRQTSGCAAPSPFAAFSTILEAQPCSQPGGPCGAVPDSLSGVAGATYVPAASLLQVPQQLSQQAVVPPLLSQASTDAEEAAVAVLDGMINQYLLQAAALRNKICARQAGNAPAELAAVSVPLLSQQQASPGTACLSDSVLLGSSNTAPAAVVLPANCSSHLLTVAGVNTVLASALPHTRPLLLQQQQQQQASVVPVQLGQCNLAAAPTVGVSAAQMAVLSGRSYPSGGGQVALHSAFSGTGCGLTPPCPQQQLQLLPGSTVALAATQQYQHQQGGSYVVVGPSLPALASSAPASISTVQSLLAQSAAPQQYGAAPVQAISQQQLLQLAPLSTSQAGAGRVTLLLPGQQLQ